RLLAHTCSSPAQRTAAARRPRRRACLPSATADQHRIDEIHSRTDAMAVEPKLVMVAGGEFLMGEDAGREDERPAHVVLLSAFRVAFAPVTVAEYRRFLGETGLPAPPPFPELGQYQSDDFPVIGTSWFDAVAYCAWL